MMEKCGNQFKKRYENICETKQRVKKWNTWNTNILTTE